MRSFWSKNSMRWWFCYKHTIVIIDRRIIRWWLGTESLAKSDSWWGKRKHSRCSPIISSTLASTFQCTVAMINRICGQLLILRTMNLLRRYGLHTICINDDFYKLRLKPNYLSPRLPSSPLISDVCHPIWVSGAGTRLSRQICRLPKWKQIHLGWCRCR